MNELLTAQLAIYAVLCIPVLYLWLTHMPTGILGWGMLFAFCSLRVVGGAMATGSHPSSTALIISSIGISPLLLTVDGILHEAQVYRNPRMSKCLEWSFLAFIHVLVATGVAMVGVGASALTGKNPTPNDLTLLEVGMALLESCWVFLCIAAVVALMPSRSDPTAATYSQGTKLLWAVLLALPFIGVRVTYGLVAECTQKASLNPITGDLAIRVVLSFLSELITVLIFIIAGFQTRKRRAHRGDRPVRQRSPRKPVTHV